MLEDEFGNALTGELSDVTACFFLPLVVSSALGFTGVARGWFTLERRVLIGSALTALVFGAVNTSSLALPDPMERPNVVDPTIS